MPRLVPNVLLVALCVFLPACNKPDDSPAAASVTGADNSDAVTLRCAVIGGVADTGLWQELGKKFEAKSGNKLEIVARGPKHDLALDFIDMKAHLIAMHSSDTIINLVADGHAVNPQPWARNDFLLVGPDDDPAGVKGMDDAGGALRKIIESESTILVHASQGSMEVLGDLMEDEHLAFDPQHTIVRIDDKQRQMLLLAGQEKAYTVIGRIPFVNGKIPKRELELDIIVEGDPRLRRPYLIATATSPEIPDAEKEVAREFVEFVRSEPVQQWIGQYGAGMYDDRPLFFRVAAP